MPLVTDDGCNFRSAGSVAPAPRRGPRDRERSGEGSLASVSRIATIRRGALAGAVAATAWGALEPLASRAFGTRYSDVRLLGRLAGAGPLWAPAGVAIHALNGAAFGALFAAAGARGPRAGIAWATVEGLLAWPAMAVVDRVHPDRRSGRWPRPLLTDGRVFAQEAAMHSLFGLLLGLLVCSDPPARGVED